ncbi:MAG TPA: ABC transporter permease [Thermomicrobiales bacterium]|nr:ABC transporter permease [Thermomicrobiales bacterium]
MSQVGPVAVAATGITFVLLCAEIDLSIASISVLCGIIATYIFSNDWHGLGQWGLLIAALVGAGVGLINGFFICYVGIPSFMMTLAMLTIAKGMGTYITQGKPIFDAPPFMETLASVGTQSINFPLIGEVPVGIPVIGYVAIGFLIMGEIILSYTKFGRYVFMTGGNKEAAEMSGIDTRTVLLNVMMISGFTAGIAGMLFVGRLKSANPQAGGNLLIDTIAAVVLGGTSLFGGEGGMKNTALGLLIFAFLSNGLNLLPNVNIYFKEALQGIILVAALVLNVVALKLEKVQIQTE